MNKKRKNLRRGFARLTLVLSIIIGAPYGCLIGTYWRNLLYGLWGALLGFASVWILYFFISYVIIPVIRFVKSGFEAK